MKPTAVNTALIMGSTSVLFSLISYILGPWAFTNIWMLVIMIAVSLTGFFYFAIKSRELNGGYYSYGQAYKFCLIVTLIWCAIAVLSKYIFILIDTPFFVKVNELMLADQIERFESFGMPEGQIDQAVIETEKAYAETLTPFGQVKGYLWMVGGFSVANLLFALFIKKNKPEFAQ